MDLTPEKEEEFMKEIHGYEEESFWDELVGKLAARDALAKYGEAKLEKLGRMDRMKAIWAEEEKYHEEFDKKGVMRLHIKK